MKNRIIIGLIISLIGFILIIIPFFAKTKVTFITELYGIPLFIIGLIIIFNKKEDKIEEINYKVQKGGKK